VPNRSTASKFLELEQEELERLVALRYEEGLIALQRRMHPEASDRPLPPGVHIQGAPRGPAVPGQGESPRELADHGRQVVAAMFEAVKDEVCRDMAAHRKVYSQARTAVPRLVRHVTRVSPPDELFVAAACVLWRQGLEGFCEPALKEGG
jgi:hypothetical protein